MESETTFALEQHNFIELHNLLKVTGICHSGGMAKMVISDGEVKVDGMVETRKRCKIRSGQRVKFAQHTVVVTA